MNKWMLVAVMASLPTLALANCDLKKFRWECDLPVNVYHQDVKGKTGALIYCDNINVYVSQKDYDQIARYQRSMVDMNLMINGEFFGGPCIPAQR